VTVAIKEFPVSQWAMWKLARIWQDGANTVEDSMKDVVQRQLYNILRRYMRRSFGLPSSM
jgi:hypothetical protein